MQIKLQTLVDTQESLMKLSRVVLPVKISYRVRKVLNKVNSEVKTWQEQRFELIKELGTQTDPKNDTWELKSENNTLFTKKMKELGDLDVEIDFEKINIDDLGPIQIPADSLVEWVFS